MRERDKIIGLMDNMGIDIESILRLSFSGYKQMKRSKQLYSDDVSIPEDLIKLYYSLNPGEISFEKMKKAFVTNYVNNESKLVSLDEEPIHGKEEAEGLKRMYEYIHSEEINYMFDAYTLKDLHRQLFSCSPFPEYGGDFRNYNVYLPGTGTDLTDCTMIREELEKLNPTITKLSRIAPKIKASEDSTLMLDYMDKCVVLGCKLIKIHPFPDGNGRTVRGFINKMLEDAGLPPIYIKTNERTEYQQAMNLANNEGNYTDIKNFYRYKVCDSIIELDINERIREYNSTKEDKDSEQGDIKDYPQDIKQYEREKVLRYFDYVDINVESIFRLCFSGYKYLKARKQLYSSDVTIPETLISLYYSLNPDEICFDNMRKAFVTRYVNNESKLEGVNDEDIHGQEEIAGFKKMYEYIHSDDVDYLFDVYTIKDLHYQLFSCTEYPEYGWDFRNYDVFLPGTGTELTEWSMIRYELDKINPEILGLHEAAPEIKKIKSPDLLLEYMDRCVEVGCKLIKIHPFSDGNGRTVRGFINKLFEDAGLPPIYIKSNERTEYQQAMNLANNEGNYEDIKNFYRYKVCDSIIELDINDRVKEFNVARGIQTGEKGKAKEKQI